MHLSAEPQPLWPLTSGASLAALLGVMDAYDAATEADASEGVNDRIEAVMRATVTNEGVLISSCFGVAS